MCSKAVDRARWSGPCLFLTAPVTAPGGGTHRCQPAKWWVEYASRYPHVGACPNCTAPNCSPPVPPAPAPKPTPVNRSAPSWDYDWGRFPAFWFGANASGFENPAQMELLGNYSLVLFGWQHMQLATGCHHLLAAQIEQARRVKERYPALPTFVCESVQTAPPNPPRVCLPPCCTSA